MKWNSFWYGEYDALAFLKDIFCSFFFGLLSVFLWLRFEKYSVEGVMQERRREREEEQAVMPRDTKDVALVRPYSNS